MTAKRIWITGAAGFLGGHVAQVFHDAGWSVSGIDIAPRPSASAVPFAGWVQGSVDASALAGVAQGGLPDCVFHAAGSGSVGRSFEDPEQDFADAVTTTQTILGFIRDQAPTATFVLPSSAAIYGACPAEPLAEDRAPAPVSPYGRHKLMAEELCHEASRDDGLRTIVVRYFSLYGVGLRKQLLWDLASKAMAADGGVELFGTGAETRDMLDVRDAARMVLSLVETAGDGATLVNGGTGRALSVREIAQALLVALGLELELRFNGEDRQGDPKHYQADTRRAQALGVIPEVRFEDGVSAYARWFRTVRREAGI